MQMIGDTTIPLALLATGISLAQIPLKDLIRPIDIWATTFIRLIVLPAVILLALLPFHLKSVLNCNSNYPDRDAYRLDSRCFRAELRM